MRTKHYIITGIALLLGFAGGFLLANSLNRAKIDALESGQKQASKGTKSADDILNADLADSEINGKLAEAGKDSGNFPLQKGLGLALYQFAALKQDEKRLDDVEVLLERAHSLNPDDYEVLVAFGNIKFDLAKLKKDASRARQAREIFADALKKNPKDVRVLNSLASTYLQTDDPDPEKAIAILDKALNVDRQNEMAVMNLARAYLADGNTSKAREYVSKLKEINTANPEIARLEGRIRMEEAK